MEFKIFNFEKSLDEHPELKQGCIVDTNVLFAASYNNDTHNEWAEEVFEVLHKNNVPIFTNMNVRSEFIDLHRRVLIPECLVIFYEDFSSELNDSLRKNLLGLSKKAWDARTNGKSLKLNEVETKKYMELFGHEPRPRGPSAWTEFCQTYFSPFIYREWPKVVQKLKINFLGTREIESGNFFDRHPSWENMISILGESGIGSADAMILNLFKESKIPLLITADKAVKNTMLNGSFKNKFILSP